MLSFVHKAASQLSLVFFVILILAMLLLIYRYSLHHIKHTPVFSHKAWTMVWMIFPILLILFFAAKALQVL